MKSLFALAKEYDMLPSGERILCAVSGGPDSMCLLAVLHHAGLNVAAAHYNHQLRGEASDEDEALVVRFCKEHEIPLEIGSGNVAIEAARRKRGLEETARDMRYAFLRQAAARMDATRIATAHNADDNAETFLLNFIRGAGLQGLCGIPPRRGEIVRPLLTTKRSEIMAYLTEHEVPYRHDASNDSLEFARNQIRHQVMPLLQEMNPRFLEHASDGIGRLRGDHAVLNAQAYAVLNANLRTSEDGVAIARTAFAGQPPAIGARVVLKALERLGNSGATARHISRILSMARSGKGSDQIELPGGITVIRSYDTILLVRQAEQDGFLPIKIEEGINAISGTRWIIRSKKTICPMKKQKKDGTFFIKYDMLKSTMIVRPRRTGDRIQLVNRPSKSIKKLFMDEKIPRWDRDRIPILADEGGLIAVAGFGPEESRLAAPGEEALELLLFEQEEQSYDERGY